ncbi:hypothetical protein ACFOKJ_03255 [Vogesella amnigena]|uniref:Uncharacterized protein n=1 Tax=Vogesella amnigena TaxID=1507449 RepID=A0ABV7TR36_9NEIS
MVRLIYAAKPWWSRAGFSRLFWREPMAAKWGNSFIEISGKMKTRGIFRGVINK